MGVGGQRHALAALPPETPGTHCIGGWVGPRAGLDGCGKPLLHRIITRVHRITFTSPTISRLRRKEVLL